MSLIVGMGFLLSLSSATLSRRTTLLAAGEASPCWRETSCIAVDVKSPDPKMSGLERLDRSSLGVWCELEHSLVLPSSSDRLPSELSVEMDWPLTACRI
uniref:Putative secreted protein n=1 Tax=Ixodes ricinus TaxID=34613 RepID=A0A6B0U5M0_IXORI